MKLAAKQVRELAPGQPIALGYVTADAYLQTPASLAYSASLSIDVSVKNLHQVGVLTGNLAITFTNPAPGRRGKLWVKQDTVGSRTIFFSAAGFTVLKDSAATDLNPQAGANTVTMYEYSMLALGGMNYIHISKTFLTPQTAESILGSNLKALWHASHGVVSSGGVVSRWDDRITNRALNPGGSGVDVTYQVDGSAFAGKPVVQTFNAGKNLQSAVAEILATGAFPYLFMVYRWRTLAGNYGRNWTLNNEMLGLHMLNSADNRKVVFINVPGIPAYSSIYLAGFDTQQHMDEVWLDGSHLWFMSDGAASTSRVSTSGFANPINQITVGFGGADAPNLSTYMMGICSTLPTLAQRAALREAIAYET